MTLKRTNLSLHKTIHHKGFLLDDANNTSLCDVLLEASKHEYPTENKDELVLFDMDTKEIVEKFDNVEKVNFEKYSPEDLILSVVYPSLNTTIKLPYSLQVLTIEGGGYVAELMSKTEESSILWDEILYELQLTQFNTTLEERIESEKRIRKMYNFDLPNLKLESPIFSLLSNITELNITALGIRNVYLTNKELNLLSNIKNIETLELSYIINNSILKLPPKLKYLKFYGSLIEDLSEINLKGLNLETLELDGNSIQNLDGISKLKNLVALNLNHNLIRYFNLNELPNKLEELYLERNIIENNFFEGTNSGIVNKKITHLVLSNNLLNVNPWLINRITETFPMLEYIDLSGNEADGVPYNFLINEEDNSCMEKIKFWLDTQDYKHTVSYSDLKSSFNYYNNTNTIAIKWGHDSLPSRLILSDIQYRYNQFFSEMGSKFKLFREGIYCDIAHNTISIIIREEANSIYLEFYSLDNKILNDYFYQHFVEIRNIVTLNTHHLILPIAYFSEKCKIYEKFFKFVFHIEKKILDNFILLPNAGEPMALIKTQKKGFLAENKNNPGNHYKKIQHIAFMIITARESFPYILDENNTISNIEKNTTKLRSTKAFELSLKEGLDKKNYVDTLTNPYLGSYCMEEAVIFVKDDARYKMNIVFNPNYFYVDSNKLYSKKTSAITMSKEYVVEPKIGVKIIRKNGMELEEGKKITITFDENDKMYLENILFSEPFKE